MMMSKGINAAIENRLSPEMQTKATNREKSCQYWYQLIAVNNLFKGTGLQGYTLCHHLYHLFQSNHWFLS